jgi:5-methyltetrahydropteroyltriglutamate--homocysteine methyltransferase
MDVHDDARTPENGHQHLPAGAPRGPATRRDDLMSASSAANAGHVDHVGSLLRPARLLEARETLLGVQDAEHNLGAHDNAELRAIEDECVLEVVRMQEEIGLPIVTDGEFRRRSWWSDFLLSLTGTRVTYDGKKPVTAVNDAGETRPMPGVGVEGRITWRGSVLAEPYRFLRSATRGTAKVTVPGPPLLHYFRDEDFVPSPYPAVEAFYEDLVAAYRAELRALANAGCRFVQFDECMLAMLCDPRQQEFSRSRGDDPEALIETYASLIDRAIAERPPDMTIGIHVCRGNVHNEFWGASGGYEPIAEALFKSIAADVYLLEYDTERAGDFSPLRHVPRGKRVMLGLLSSKRPELEDRDELLRRIDEAGRYVAADQLGLSPQCGFSTNVLSKAFTATEERRKLEHLVEVAAAAWG